MKALRRSSTSTSPSSSSSPTAASSPPSSSWIHIRSLLVAAASSNSSSSAAAAAAGTSVAALASASAAAPSSSSPAASSSPRSDRGGIKSPWSRRKRKRVLSRQQWDSQFSANGKLRDGGKKVLKKVRSGGIEPGIRAEVWPFLLGVYDLNSSEEERNTIKIKKSNYDIFHTRDRLAYAKIKPAVNQIETHPYFQRDSLVKFCQKHGIRVTAHTPLSGSTANTERYGGSASCLDDPIIKSLAEKYRARPPLGDPEEHGGHPKTSKAERLVENLSVFDFNISYEDMDKIKAIDRSHRTAQPTKFWGIDVFA